MEYKSQIRQMITALVIFGVSTPLMAVSSVATVNVKVSRFLSVTNTSAMYFGEVSINSVAGAVTLKADGTRETLGGARLSSSDSFSPAKFIIEGDLNADYSVSYPQEVRLTDGHGNTLIVDQFNGEQVDAGESDARGLRELAVGGRLNLEPYQARGDYSGTLLIEVEYR